MTKSILEKCELVEEAGQFYLKLVYIIDDDARIRRITIPKAKLPLNRSFVPEVSSEYRSIRDFNKSFFVRAGYDNCILPLESVEGVCYKEEILKEKTRKLTVSEIERKLGYKIEIVSEDSKR